MSTPWELITLAVRAERYAAATCDVSRRLGDLLERVRQNSWPAAVVAPLEEAVANAAYEENAALDEAERLWCEVAKGDRNE